MKISIISFGLVLSIVSLAFWKMEGPFGQSINNDGSLKRPIELLNQNSVLSVRNDRYYDYIYTYCYQTGYSIGGKIGPSESHFASTLVFLLGKNLDNTHTTYSNGPYNVSSQYFHFFKEESNVEQQNSTELNESTKLYPFLKHDYKLYFSNLKKDVDNLESRFKEKNLSEDDLNYMLNCLRRKKDIPIVQFTPININRNFITQSGVEIFNLDKKVEIRKNGETFDFQKELIEYYDCTNLTDLAREFSHIPTSKTIEKFRVIPNVGKNELQRLKDSTILALYAVIKDESGKDSILWGLAQDETTLNKERFHWMTNLECDISLLFNKNIKK